MSSRNSWSSRYRISTDGRTYVGLPVTGLGFVSHPCASIGAERLDLLAELVRRSPASRTTCQFSSALPAIAAGIRRGASA